MTIFLLAFSLEISLMNELIGAIISREALRVSRWAL